MKVSAIIPTFNRRAYVKRAIDSVLSQTVPVDEIFVVDDGSTDGTAESIRAKYDNLVRVITQEHKGVSAARRLAVHEARGEWVAFLDSDDEWTPNRNEELVRAASNAPAGVGWIFGDSQLVTDEQAEDTLYKKYGLTLSGYTQVFEDTWSIHHPFQFGMLQSSFIKRSALLEVDCFSEGLSHSEDFLVGIQIACRYQYAAVPLVVTRIYRTSDLKESSIESEGMGGEDYFRARIMAFSLVARAAGRQPWGELYAGAVRGLCKVLAKQGQLPRGLARQQFRFGGVSAKGAAFFCAALFGCRGIQTWNKIAEFRRKLLPEETRIAKRGFQAHIQSVAETNK